MIGMGYTVKKKGRCRPERPTSITNLIAASIWFSAPSPPWIDLPRDVTANILHRLGAKEMLESAQKVCATWRVVCKDPAMWRVIDMRNCGVDLNISQYLGILCRHAVDRSRGELIDIHIEYFGTDDLLHYISDRSSRLKRVSISCCERISGGGLTSAVKRWPELEELHLFNMPWITDIGDIEAIGICCPMMKSFTFDRLGKMYWKVNNNYALTIAKNMPNLRHLGLIGNELGEQGLQAILDGCPHLESLDIRECYEAQLRGDLDKRCSERIKDMRRPYDSIDDYECDDEVEDDYGDSDSDSDSDDFDNYYICASE